MKLKRPKNSNGLDCVNLYECKRVLLDHLSLSWSCDELLSVVRCQDVTAQWCLLAEPLGRKELHPYGDEHAYCLNASASTLTVHHCLFAHYVMRGPQFEANDMRRGDRWPVKMEAIGNVMFDSHRSAMRVTAGVEDHKEEAKDRSFQFQFLGNVIIDGEGRKRPVEIIIKHGVHPGVRIGVVGNDSPRREGMEALGYICVLDGGKPWKDAPKALSPLIKDERLFTSPHSPSASTAWNDFEVIVQQVGCSWGRDEADERVIRDLTNHRDRSVLRSQREVGGWPPLDGSRSDPRRLTRQLFGR